MITKRQQETIDRYIALGWREAARTSKEVVLVKGDYRMHVTRDGSAMREVRTDMTAKEVRRGA